MGYTIYVTHDEDMSPAEFAQAARTALVAAGLRVTRVQAGDIETILWTARQEEIEGIEFEGPGYGAPRHLEILRRAGF